MRYGLRPAAVLIMLLLTVLPLSAHPLGNFTINHLSILSVGADTIGVHYVLDLAEIPTYQEMRKITSRNTLTPEQSAAWAQTQAARLLPQMRLDVAGHARRLVLENARAVVRPGAGGLPTLYLVINAHSSIASARSAPPSIVYRDTTFSGRVGWRDVVVAHGFEPTHELRFYPSGSLSSARATTAVAIDRDRSGRLTLRTLSLLTAPVESGAAVAQKRSNELSDMLARGTSDLAVVLLTLLAAIALGALHALEPGHGKTLLAISLVGARATIKQAAILAGALTIAHTIGVIALGIAINCFRDYFVPESIYPWITLGSGSVIAVIGGRAIQRQLHRLKPAIHTHGVAHQHLYGDDNLPHKHGPQSHGPDARHWDHADGDDDAAHARAHVIEGNAPLTFAATLWAAMSGGVAPCPAALVVLLAAVALNQVAYGICVIVAFSFGLAATLTGLGIAVVRGSGWLQRQPGFERFVTLGPAVSAVVIATIGALMVGQGFAQNGSTIAPAIVTGVVALAIAGYAFSHPSAHRHIGPKSQVTQ